MRNGIRLYSKFFIMHLKTQMQYKYSFFMLVFGRFIISFTSFLGMFFMFDRFSEIEGFTFSEALLGYCAILSALSIGECFFRGFDMFPMMISNGEFDRILVRPVNDIFQVASSKMDFTRIGYLIQAAVLAVYAVVTSEINWTPDKVIVYLSMNIFGSVTFAGLFVLVASFSFFTIEGLEFMNIFTDGGKEYGRYPLSIYGKWAMRFFTYIVPFALFQYYPLLYVLGRTDNVFYAFLPVVSMVFILPCLAIWNFSKKRYRSTGS